MVRADELYNEVTQDASGKGASQGMFVGCFVDTATGWVSFTCEGKETSHKFKMEPDTKLFPAIFVEATSKEILQIELGRTSTTLPLSAAVLQNSERHVIPQFPPRLKVQCLKPHQWARVPNQSLQVHALKLSDIRGWSMLCEDAISMLALHIPEEDRCIDILELIEMDKLLRFEILKKMMKKSIVSLMFRGSTFDLISASTRILWRCTRLCATNRITEQHTLCVSTSIRNNCCTRFERNTCLDPYDKDSTTCWSRCISNRTRLRWKCARTNTSFL